MPGFLGGFAQGLSGLPGAISGIQREHEKDKELEEQANAYYPFYKDKLPREALERWGQMKGREKLATIKAFEFGQEQDLLKKKQALQEREGNIDFRVKAAQANHLMQLYGQESGAGGAQPKGKIWSNELGGWATPAQADAARRRTTQGYLAQSYGLTPEQIFDSSQHEGGTVAVDPTTGAKVFTNDPKGDQIRIGGATGVVMPKAEHEVYKRQIQMNLGTTPMAGGAAGAPRAPEVPGAAAGGAGTVRVRSPQGVVGTIPANRLQEALQAGYTQM